MGRGGSWKGSAYLHNKQQRLFSNSGFQFSISIVTKKHDNGELLSITKHSLIQQTFKPVISFKMSLCS